MVAIEADDEAVDAAGLMMSLLSSPDEAVDSTEPVHPLVTPLVIESGPRGDSSGRAAHRFTAEVATTPQERRKGLMGHKPLSDAEVWVLPDSDVIVVMHACFTVGHAV